MNKKIRAVKPPKDAKNTWTITLSQEIADAVDRLYAKTKKHLPHVVSSKQKFVEGMLMSGICQIHTNFATMDAIADEMLNKKAVDPDFSMETMMNLIVVQLMNEEKLTRVLRELKRMQITDGKLVWHPGQNSSSPTLSVVSNEPAPTKNVKKPEGNTPPDVA